MSKQDLTMIFAETLEKIYSEENRHNVEEKLRAEQNFGDTPEENLVLKINTEILLEKSFLFEVLSRVLPQVEQE